MKKTITISCYLILICCFQNANAQSFDWEKANQDFLTTYQETTYDEGLEKAEALLAKTAASYGEKHVYYARALYNVAALHTEVSNVKAGIPLAEKALALFVAKDMPLERAFTLAQLARLSAGVGQVANKLTLEHLNKAFTLLRELSEARNSLEFGAALYRGGLLAMNGNDFTASEKYLEEAIKLLERIDQRNSPMYATCLEAKALLFGLYLGRHSQLEVLYKESFEIREKLLGTKHPDFQSALEFVISYYEEVDPEKATYYTNLKDDELMDQVRYPHYGPSGLRPWLLTEKFIPYTLSYSQESASGEAMGVPDVENGDIDMSSFIDTEDMGKSAEAMNEMIAQMARSAYGEVDPKTGVIDPKSMMDTTGFNARLMNSPEMQDMIKMTQKISANAYAQFAEGNDDLSPLAKISARIMSLQASGEPVSKELKEEELSAYRQEYGEYHNMYRDKVLLLADEYVNEGKFTAARKHHNGLIDGYLQQFSQFDYMSEEERSAFWDQVKQSIFDYYEFVMGAVSNLPEVSTDAYNYQLKTKSKVLNKTARIKRLVYESKDKASRIKFERWTDLRNQIAKAGLLNIKERTEQHIDLDKIYQEANGLEKEIAEIMLGDDKLSAEIESEPDWQDIQKALPTNAAAIEIIRYGKTENSGGVVIGNYEDTKPKHYAALIITAQTKYPTIVQLGEAKVLDRNIYNLYLEYVSNTRYKPESTGKYLALSEQYWKPLANALPANINEVYLSPSGTYNLINVEILPIESGQHVMDSYTVHRVSGTAGIVTAANKTPSTNINSVAFFGDPAFTLTDEEWAQQSNTAAERAIGSNNNRSTSTWLKRARINPLLWTRAEVENLEILFKNQNWEISKYLGAAASEEQLKQLTSPKILHVATHGYFDRTNSGVDQKQMESFGDVVKNSGSRQNAMLGAGLLFAGVKNHFESNQNASGEDGALTAYEISSLYLNNTELVVLSACNTGQGLVDEGEGVYGLQRAFKLAGAESLLMSLWSINDKASADLMVEFYKNMLSGKSKKEALHLAQKEIMKAHPEPYYWGAFILVD